MEQQTQPLWFKDAIIYQIHPRAFYDKNSDGIGDFLGLTEKLDYLKELGITAIWLLPFYPSPLRDDGYDIADYNDINPAYGTLRDFRVFIREAHRRGLRVITELVINHTSDQHAWFQRARTAPVGSRWRDFYVWSDTSARYQDARIIFKDFELSNWTWDSVANAYYWHRFYSHQPDLNFDSPYVKRAVFRALDFWFKLGVDGLRLDAIPYLYEREGTNCENLPETHVFLKKLRSYVDDNYTGRMLLAEANQWPEDAVAYFGQGDECHMSFHFPLMPRMFKAVRMEDRYPIIDIMQQTPQIPSSCQWAIFLRNHDELTLEMVTDEERDYMYRVYARDRHARINLGIRRRLAPLMENDRRKIQLMNGLLFSMPGTPVMYYGDEIGMGDNVFLGDRNGVRTPMQWNADRNGGFSLANPQQMFLPMILDPEYHYETVNVEAQQRNSTSLLWWMKRLIAMNKRFRAFGRGTLEFLTPANRKVLAFIRRYEEETILVVANLSRFAEYVELDLSQFQGMNPVELAGNRTFPQIGELPYLLTIGAYDFYRFSLQPLAAHLKSASGRGAELPQLVVAEHWEQIFGEEGIRELEPALNQFVTSSRWFIGESRAVHSIVLLKAIPLSFPDSMAINLLIQVTFTYGEPEVYSLPLTFATGQAAEALQRDAPQVVVARVVVESQGAEGILFDALWDQQFTLNLLDTIERRRHLRVDSGAIVGMPEEAFRTLHSLVSGPLETTTLAVDQDNTSVVYQDQSRWNIFILKYIRRLEPGVNPEVDVGRYLTEKVGFSAVPALAGTLEYQESDSEPVTLAVLHGFVANEGDAWQFTLNALTDFFGRAVVYGPPEPEQIIEDNLLDLLDCDLPPEVDDLIGHYFEVATLLGQRTAELHLALAAEQSDENFRPEPATDFSRRSRYQTMRNLTTQVFESLRQRSPSLPPEIQTEVLQVLDLESELLERFRAVNDRRIAATRIRCHGDYHLGQILLLGKDLVIIDFEGEVARLISQRRFKASPLRDVAGMVSSFRYASHAALLEDTPGANRAEDMPLLEQWASIWHRWVSVAFLKSYLSTEGIRALLPDNQDDLQLLLDAYLLEKAVYEMGHDLNNRPSWLRVPLKSILEVVRM